MTAVDEVASFLRAVWPDLGGHFLLLWGAPSKRSEWVDAITDEVVQTIITWGDKENIYMGCGLRSKDFGPTLRGEKKDVVAIPGVWLDIDVGSNHKKPNLPPTYEDAWRLIHEMGPEPSIVLSSGHGLQAWWLFREPWILTTEEDRANAERLTKGWCNTLRAKAKAHGWDADQVGDLTRVMRLPGTWNHKGIKKRVSLHDLTSAV